VKERRAVERVVGRMYRHFEKSKGRLPDANTVRAMKERAEKTALLVDNRKKRG